MIRVTIPALSSVLLCGFATVGTVAFTSPASNSKEATASIHSQEEGVRPSVKKPSVQRPDYKILEVVLSHLLNNPKFHEAPGNKEILLSDKTPEQPLDPDLHLPPSRSVPPLYL
jgi:hypothetical protein